MTGGAAAPQALYATMLISGMWGVLTGYALWRGLPLVFVGELGGPINMAVPVVLITAVALIPAAWTSSARGGIRGAISSLPFSCPVAFACHWIAHSDPVILREHGGEFRFCGFAVVALALLVMGFVGKARSPMPRPPD